MHITLTANFTAKNVNTNELIYINEIMIPINSDSPVVFVSDENISWDIETFYKNNVVILDNTYE